MKVKVLNASSKKTRCELKKAFADLLQEKKSNKKYYYKRISNKSRNNSCNLLYSLW